MSGLRYGRTMFDNESGHPEELTFQKSDILTILKTEIDGAPGWWLCQKGNKVGIAPGNFIEKLPSNFVPHFKIKDNRLDMIDQRSSRAPSGDYSHPRNPKMHLREGVSQLNVQHRQVEQAFDRVHSHYTREVLKCDQMDVMKWGAVVRHFWTLCDNYSSSILLFTKFIRISVLETIDENVDFVVVGKLSNRLNTLDLDFQGYSNLLKITKLQFNENTPKNIHALIERGEKLPTQIQEVYATLKANKSMFFTEEEPKWAEKRGVRRASYEDVDCMDFLTQAIEVRNRNELKIDIPIIVEPPARKSAPSSPNRIRDMGGMKGRSRSKTELNETNLFVPNLKTKLSTEKFDSVRERKFSNSISQQLSKLKLKSNQKSFLKSSKVNSAHKIVISSPSNPQMLQSVSSDFAVSKARAVTMTTPVISKRRAATESNIIEGGSVNGQFLPVSPGRYESMAGVSNFSSLPAENVSHFNYTKSTPIEVTILTELYLQLEQVLTSIKESTRRLKFSMGASTPDPLVYSPLVQNMTAHIYKCIFLLQISQNSLADDDKNLAKYIENLSNSAKNIISKCKEFLKAKSSKISTELTVLTLESTNQISDIIVSVMAIRHDTMSASEV
ncbi:Breast cancer anti-estrogen resistance protein 1-like [Oopsacas minuta]|uniref:Breast cancer anti-estrogen resistance protein 1-like n=1 Tax=Oopsacas minuta TaxID=111878 RepID=A0AAV7JN26_9METZ|nr:Breast cancer anti-estrogen resistance protein 1-like [Oopsacas minuta]